MVTFDSIERERKQIAGTMVWVATPAALCRLKKDTVRAKDHQDGTRVQKFRSIEEMNAAYSLDARNGDFERFLRHCARFWQLAPRVYPRGVFRFRSIDEAEAARSRHRPASKQIDQ
jgi:hypothetical protein